MSVERDAERVVERAWCRVLVERVAADLGRLDDLADHLRPRPVRTVDEDPLECQLLEVEERLLAALDELRRRVERADAQ